MYNEAMKITFDYNLEMEWDNLRRGMNSKNNTKPSAKVSEMLSKDINIDSKKEVSKYFKDEIHQNNLDIPSIQKSIDINWQKIEREAVAKMNQLFKAKLDDDITVYLTLNDRCGYNIDQKYFFVNLRSTNPNSIILHELLHFYTYEYILPEFKQRKLSYEIFNDYKEALTFLLNIEFADLLDGWVDKGYEKQKDMRLNLEKSWPKFKTVRKLTNYFLDNSLTKIFEREPRPSK